MDAVIKEFNKEVESAGEDDSLPHLAIVGKPNVGKSSLVNALTGEERNIVTDISGTATPLIHVTMHSDLISFSLTLREYGKKPRLLRILSIILYCVPFVLLKILMYAYS